MRILVVADLHYSLPQYDWLLAEAPRYDLVVIAGDHVDLSSPVDGGHRLSSSRNTSTCCAKRPAW